MGRLFILENDDIPVRDCIRCSICKTQVALVDDFIGPGPDIRWGVFTKLFNVQVPDDSRYHTETKVDPTLADTYCVRCGMLIGWKIIAVPKPYLNYRVGRFLMKSNRLKYWNDVTLLQANFEVPNNNQAGGANDHDEGANEQAPNEQDLGVNEQNVDQDGGTDDQVGAANDQDEGANEQNADQDEDANEQNDDEEDGGAPMNEMKII